ncbi:transcriptional regulator BetI [Sediminicurvatus halobius]|uniref:HTH-type transcriptional regulator BetI n=1 Tax=Sediminicurvatus halobius TaxID=2182432 RepID=A0A2U2N0B2_9GAMM|nr:transcriptional regulator BetI [Spiribacter halobius]PWG62473.1 transcriptional regulator BetI [Spiribacter halobius]UEX78563.1 transcriptional regulator BetI [Spiribacter halobius]
MPKRGMEPIRQRQFIEATLQIIHEQGLHETTLARVGRRAGASPGLVAHYFGDKSGLLAATLRHLARELAREYRERRRTAEPGLGQVLAIIDANFAPSQSGAVVVSGWLSFWAQVNHHPELARIQRIVTRRLESNLLHALRGLLAREDARHVAEGLGVMIDGLWLRASMRTGGFDISQARELARDYLISQLRLRGGETQNVRIA